MTYNNSYDTLCVVLEEEQMSRITDGDDRDLHRPVKKVFMMSTDDIGFVSSISNKTQLPESRVVHRAIELLRKDMKETLGTVSLSDISDNQLREFLTKDLKEK